MQAAIWKDRSAQEVNDFPAMLSIAAFLMTLPLQPPRAAEPSALHRAAQERDAGEVFAGPVDWETMGYSWLDSVTAPIAYQVRIEQHIILRVSPRRNPERDTMMPVERNFEHPRRFVERRMGKCIEIGDIAGVRPESGSRLLLFMRDRHLIAADLEKACAARDFYSGFYIEKNDDGRLCVDRDKLLARSGSRCRVARLSLIVPVEE